MRALRGEGEGTSDESKPGAVRVPKRLEGQLVDRPPLHRKRSSKADMAQRNYCITQSAPPFHTEAIHAPPQQMNVETPLSDIKYPNTLPDPLPFAYLSIARNPKQLEKMRAGQGTPRLLVRPRNLGARPSRERPTRMREARKREELPAETTVYNGLGLVRI